MPVIDHEVHHKTEIVTGHRYGCHNKPRPVAGSAVAHAKAYGGSHPYRMSVECRFDMSLSDPHCTDCKWRGSGESYSNSIREAANPA